MTEKQGIKEIMRRAADIKPTVHVGKEGLSEAIALELKDQIKRNKVVKVRVLSSSALGASEVAEQLAQSTDSVLVDVRGSNAVFCERREYRNLSQKKNL